MVIIKIKTRLMTRFKPIEITVKEKHPEEIESFRTVAHLKDTTVFHLGEAFLHSMSLQKDKNIKEITISFLDRKEDWVWKRKSKKVLKEQR